HPHHRVWFGVLGGDPGEPAVDPDVRLPPASMEGGRLDRVVVERPQRRVGVALVVVLVVVLGERDGAHPDAVDVWHGWRGVDSAGPTDPGRAALAEDRMQRGDQAAGAASPFPCAVIVHGLVDGKAVRHDCQGSTRHCGLLLQPKDGRTMAPPFGAEAAGSTHFYSLNVR